MRLPAKTQRLLRQYERIIFYSDHPRSKRVYSLYLLLRPILTWLYKELVTLGLEKDEVESEIYIFADNLHRHFDDKKSSIVPYLERYIPWRAANIIEKFQSKPYTEVSLEECQEGTYSLPEEIYLTIPNVLYENKWLLRGLQRSEKYLIFLILQADADKLTQSRLAEEANIGRKKLREILDSLSNILNNGGYHGPGQ